MAALQRFVIGVQSTQRCSVCIRSIGRIVGCAAFGRNPIRAGDERRLEEFGGEGTAPGCSGRIFERVRVSGRDVPAAWRSSLARALAVGVDRSEVGRRGLHVVEDNQVPEKAMEVERERDYTGTKHIPIFVMLPLGVINSRNKVDKPKGLRNDLKVLKQIGVDGVMVDCWWGLVEGKGPREYNWSGYKYLFNILSDLKLKVQVVMSFHQCGGNVGDDTYIPLPLWVREVGIENADIFFTNRKGNRNVECLTMGVDEERVLRGRTALEVYYEFMNCFRQEMFEFLTNGTITEIEVGLGPCGELRYPSYPETQGWVYPGIGEFQCYDKYLLKSLMKAAEERGHLHWGTPPFNAGSYNDKPQDTGFFRDGGDYYSSYGRFFLEWYSQSLIEHGDRVLTLAKVVFEGTKIAAKISGIHWWYDTASHAAELTCGYYNTSYRDGYISIAQMLAKHKATFNFTCIELITSEQTKHCPQAMTNPEGLVRQVFNSAWDAGVHLASENALPCYDARGYNKILENSKRDNCHDGRELVAFTYLRLNSELMEDANYLEFTRFVRRLHGKSIADLRVVVPEPRTVAQSTKKHEGSLKPLVNAARL